MNKREYVIKYKLTVGEPNIKAIGKELKSNL